MLRMSLLFAYSYFEFITGTSSFARVQEELISRELAEPVLSITQYNFPDLKRKNVVYFLTFCEKYTVERC